MPLHLLVENCPLYMRHSEVPETRHQPPNIELAIAIAFLTRVPWLALCVLLHHNIATAVNIALDRVLHKYVLANTSICARAEINTRRYLRVLDECSGLDCLQRSQIY